MGAVQEESIYPQIEAARVRRAGTRGPTFIHATRQLHARNSFQFRILRSATQGAVAGNRTGGRKDCHTSGMGEPLTAL